MRFPRPGAWVAGMLVVLAICVLLLPTQGRPRETAQRVKCASNLRQIGLACAIYANAHQGQYPARLSDAFLAENLDAYVATCPNNDTPPTSRPTSWIDTHTDYIYLAAGLKYDLYLPKEVILAYEKPNNHRPKDDETTAGLNVLFANGQVEFILLDQFPALLTTSSKAREQWEKRESQHPSTPTRP